MQHILKRAAVGAMLWAASLAHAAGPLLPPPEPAPLFHPAAWQVRLSPGELHRMTHARGAEPVDPAEQRVQTLPPPRPTLRAGAASWVHLGPTPTRNAQVGVPPNDEVTGAIQAIAAHPSNASILYIGAVNGGIWRSNNATAASPTWAPLTDALPSLSIGALAFDPLDGTRNTLVAGTGRWSNFAQRGDDEIGVYRTTNGGSNWTLLGGLTLLGQKFVGVAARGSILMAASRNGGLFRSANTGADWVLVSGSGNLPSGGIGDFSGDPSSNSRFYISVLGTTPKVLRSSDNGATWTDVTTGISGLGSTTGNIRIAVGPTGAIFVAVVNSGRLAGVYRSGNLGASWTAMDVPAVHPGSQGTVNTSIVVDPTNANIVYIAGDRITASPFTGDVRRGDASLAAGSQFVSIVDGNAQNTTPHADSRAMAFDANGNLLQSDDGGIYRRTLPRQSTGVWQSVIGNLAVTEVHDLDHDRVSNILVIGTQDNGTHMQQTSASPIWTSIFGGDGGDIAIDDESQAGAASFRFISSQNLGNFRRQRYNPANALVGSTTMPAITGPQFVTPVETNLGSPNRLLVGGSTLLFESTNADVTPPTLTSIGGPGANRNAMSYGTRANPNAGYVGKNAIVYRRDAGGFVATAALPAGAATITDVAMDPDNSALVFAVDDNQVFRSSNSGGSWQDVTFDLPAISARDFRTIEYIERPGGADLVAVGTRSGVFVMAASGNAWSLLGADLPDVLVFDLRYQASNQRLYAGTLGRGVWAYDFSSAVVFANGFE
jgi:hypothetical protein